ncbi:nuclear transport factor 2 family protein [Sporichthya polymorpha]|uniref:nuclear transport factor 2 family protein n=1 Tax=Sporichthya polymorpha TaxID=35751 RepID=UPI0003656502|nr:limonene-1,2-epoxide hydrolase family protein [Sporichthya polymorpha]
MTYASLPPAIVGFLAALERRDLDGVLDHFTADATYAYAMPLPALEGREAIGAMFGKLLVEAEAVRWDIVGYTVDGDRVWTERVDRFTFAGREVPIEVAGIFELAGEKIRAVRDYVDMATWRERKDA